MEFKVKRKVTRSVLKIDFNKDYFVRFDTAIEVGKELKTRAGEAKKQPARIANVTNMETGEENILVIAEVVNSNLEEHYPDHKYVGKVFMLKKTKGPENKQYHLWEITEVELESDSEENKSGKKK